VTHALAKATSGTGNPDGAIALMAKPMAETFVGIDLRLVRVSQQLEQLQGDIDSFFTHDRRVIERAAAEHRRPVSRADPDPIPLPLMWSIRVAEIVHNIRSALDHLVWQLVIRRTGAPPTIDRSEFPAVETLRGFERRAGRHLTGVGAKERAIIKSVQPFETGGAARNPLWQLRQLSNWCRHSDVLLVAARVNHAPSSGTVEYRVVFAEPVFVDHPSVTTVLHAAAVMAEGVVNRLR
jgi:hypothetical protein